ncbi:hypothetical protein AK812_SmicGene23424 [Symbiodinium microadriaticum]|uniref:Uncharacterized protein n=1 Tax=Symbiodinium microadriaticum TaxID=2951 RepID=A0A1Q9DH83_SYMMI|nr:hypothetical protein AK812_SmicGene23424 [Symbiodinium microadriaticum]
MLWTYEVESKAREAKELEEKVLQAQGLKPEPMVRPMTEQTLRTDGCEEVNRMLHSIATEVADVPAVGSDKKLPLSYQSDSGEASPSKSPVSPGTAVRSQTETRLQWRNKMDNSLRRLMLNMELDGDERLRDFAHQARCNHLDKIFDWYTTHGGKEVRKEAQRATAPAFVRYNQDGPVMPGSLRVPKTNEKAKARQAEGAGEEGRGAARPLSWRLLSSARRCRYLECRESCEFSVPIAEGEGSEMTYTARLI